MSELPSEILNIVYKHSSNKDVLQCALTCKRWKESALIHYYNSLSIDASRVLQTKELLQLDLSERDRYFQNGTFTKKLVVHRDDRYHIPYDLRDTVVHYTKEEWILLLKYLPNIQVLDLFQSKNSLRYMDYILNCTESDKILHKTRAIIVTNSKSHMAGTKVPNDIYFALCYKYRATITTLEVEYNSKSFKSGPINGNMLTMLYHFNSLTHLTFNNSCDDQLTTFDIMDAFPHLVSLDYKSKYMIPEVIVENILGGDTNRKKLNSSFKELHLTIPTISMHYADYIKDYVAPHLDVLKLKICNMEIFDWVKRFGLYNAVGFLRSLSKVKTASIIWEPHEHDDRLINTSTKSENTVFFTLLNAMIRNKNMHFRAQYIYGRAHKSLRVTPEDHLYFDYNLKESDYNLPLTNQDFEQGYSLSLPAQFSIPNRSTSIIGPEVIHQFNVSLGDSHQNLPLEILRYALVNCPNLQTFCCQILGENNHTILLDVTPKKGNDIVKSIPNSINATKAHIKVIKTESIVPSKEMMCLIHQYLPAVERLICILDDLTYPFVELFEVDLTAFIYLKSVRLDVQLFNYDRQNTAFLEIQFSDKDWEYYHLWGNSTTLTVTKTTLEHMNERISIKEYGDVGKAVIQCRKQVKFELFSNRSRTTEIYNGKISKLDEEIIIKLRHISYSNSRVRLYYIRS
ncbi:hypothetical protein INT47_001259 [Mucor saturninus]|uniref:F-box domain-containing protein n=1 Tax=Mucor saturninus TaxID=64648 RepID=A0A8H7RM38_9FUNG|nr:hypothetical protein INT47_001259 [Mucor saturninus]